MKSEGQSHGRKRRTRAKTHLYPGGLTSLCCPIAVALDSAVAVLECPPGLAVDPVESVPPSELELVIVDNRCSAFELEPADDPPRPPKKDVLCSLSE